MSVHYGQARTVVTSRDAPVSGELAWALACGASMAVPAGRAWNLLVDPHARLDIAYERLGDWGITSTETFHATLRRLLDEGIDRDVEEALSLRRQAWQHRGHLPDLSAWLDIIARVSPEPAYARHVEIARRVVRYESAFRRDGLLPPDELVHTARAYDWGRAISVVHWGLTVGVCDLPTATSAVQYAGRLCARMYGSWFALSAGYTLGRMLRYDDDRFSQEWYGDSLATHQALATSPDSPWRTLPWPAPPSQQPVPPLSVAPLPPAPPPQPPPSEGRLLVRGFLLPLAVAATVTSLALGALGVVGWLESLALGSPFFALSIVGALARPADRKLGETLTALVPSAGAPQAKVGAFGYAAMALGMPSFLFAIFSGGTGGIVAGGLAATLGVIGRVRSVGPSQVRNRFMANVGVLAGAFGVLVGFGVMAARSLTS